MGGICSGPGGFELEFVREKVADVANSLVNYHSNFVYSVQQR